MDYNVLESSWLHTFYTANKKYYLHLMTERRSPQNVAFSSRPDIFVNSLVYQKFKGKWLRPVGVVFIECRKTKTKVTTLANHKGHR